MKPRGDAIYKIMGGLSDPALRREAIEGVLK